MDTQKVGRSRVIKQAVQFFYTYAGYSYDPKTQTPEQGRMQTARALAKAERDAASQGIRFGWEPDVEGCIGCDCGLPECKCASGEPHEVLVCLAYNTEGKVIASLGAICEPTREYRRVVEAELALEAIS